MTNITKESQLIIKLLNHILFDTKELDNTIENIDWVKLYDIAEFHSLSPLVHYALSKIEEESPLSPLIKGGIKGGIQIKTKLRESYYDTLAKNTLLYYQLEKIIPTLESAGISIVLLKGAEFALTIYPDIALRPMCDIDIFVNKKDWEKIKIEIEKTGFISGEDDNFFNENISKERNYVSQDNPKITLDFHFGLVAPEGLMKNVVLDESEIWSRISNIEQSNDEQSNDECLSSLILHSSFFILSIEDNIIYTSLHSARHQYSKVIWLLDIALLIRKFNKQINYDVLVERTLKAKAKYYVFYALYFAKELFAIDIPESAMKKLQPSFIRKRIINLFINTDIIANKNKLAESPLQRYGLKFLLIDNLFDIVKVALWGLFPNAEWIKWQYRTDRVWLYRLLHPLIIIAKFFCPSWISKSATSKYKDFKS